MVSSSSSSSTSDNSDNSMLPHLLQVQTEPAAPTVVHGINIQSRVMLVLNFNDANYVTCARSFSAIFGQYGLRDHVDGTPAKGDNDWVQNDCAIMSWFYTRISPELLSMVSGDADTAYSLWRGVRNLFRDNKDTRAVYLGAEFRNFYQGNLPVLDYCSKMKVMADRLAGLGAPVNDKDLIYNIVRGLNPRLHHAIPHITLRRRLPSFLKTRSMLQVEEHRIAESEKMQATAGWSLKPQPLAPPRAVRLLQHLRLHIFRLRLRSSPTPPRTRTRRRALAPGNSRPRFLLPRPLVDARSSLPPMPRKRRRRARLPPRLHCRASGPP
ncbi:uncharacterized protein C2845_PM18G09590 [Panicum miliaceum]|uniref:Uncharacterized protein n=1 Tax=Panicum miliaceum TaxID=4540 RepID=A0A3L6PMN3_PANMI|nr:uncharacterized protein C2845_PM18G09590 [Panicum miliaceum]